MSITQRTPRRPGGYLSSMDPERLSEFMREFRGRTLALVADLDERQMIGPRLAIVNPPLWEIGHIAWFMEFWVLRHLKKQKPLLANADQLYNSTDVVHDARWQLSLPSREETLRYMDEVFERALEHIGPRPLSSDELYFYLLALFHEGMHAEALAYTRQTLAYPAPKLTKIPVTESPSGTGCIGDVEISGGKFIIGADRDFPFVFDNEKWAHPVAVKPFRIARAAVTNGEFLEFVEDHGYRKPQYWSAAGRNWLQTGGAPELEKSFSKFFKTSLTEQPQVSELHARLDHPIYWRRASDGSWRQRVYDQELPLDEYSPVIHVNWFEAEAYCKWAKRRLPSEVEWEVAASAEPGPNGGLSESRRHFPWGDEPPMPARANLDWHYSGPVAVALHGAGDSAYGCRQMIGNVWEWTADDFKPYPGFTIDPYKEYSNPWFGTHKVLRGGCWATSSLLIRNTWRNFYTPDRRDVWAGFRTCAT